MNKTKITARFGQNNVNWMSEPEHNKLFITAQNQWANDLLSSRGHLFLNEVYDMLSLPRTSEGQLLGWLHADETRVEFAQSEPDVDGAIDLEFTVDGEIYNKI